MSDDEEIDIDEMQCALSAIGNEIHKFNNENASTNNSANANNSINDLMKSKIMLKLRREQIKLLRRNLKTACFIAKALSTAKENETEYLKNQLSSLRSKYWDLAKQEREIGYSVCVVQAENQTLRDKLQAYNNFIDLGYKDLQQQQEENVEENVNNLARLQKIIISCGQYHAEYQNQVVKSKQLEQRIRFLNSKLRIVESNLEVTSAELKRHHPSNGIKLLAKRNNKSESQLCTNLGVECSVYDIGQHKSLTNLRMIKIELNKESLLENLGDLDLTSHFVMIKKLLNDQDTIIKDLKSLSNEVNLETFLR